MATGLTEWPKQQSGNRQHAGKGMQAPFVAISQSDLQVYIVD